jgi:L-cysteine S-thiosulfotransferase
MLRFKMTLNTVVLAIVMTVGSSFASNVFAESFPSEKGCKALENPTAVQKGWCLSVNRRKGNCLACHVMVIDAWPEGFPQGGNIGPPLVAMKQRFPDREKLRSQIYDPTTVNSSSRMPPFGKHKILSDEDIETIIEFLYSI